MHTNYVSEKHSRARGAQRLQVHRVGIVQQLAQVVECAQPYQHTFTFLRQEGEVVLVCEFQHGHHVLHGADHQRVRIDEHEQQHKRCGVGIEQFGGLLQRALALHRTAEQDIEPLTAPAQQRVVQRQTRGLSGRINDVDFQTWLFAHNLWLQSCRKWRQTAVGEKITSDPAHSLLLRSCLIFHATFALLVLTAFCLFHIHIGQALRTTGEGFVEDRIQQRHRVLTQRARWHRHGYFADKVQKPTEQACGACSAASKRRHL
mmetsp:Transcript_43384/g.75402  ORF Transcript_43384/g.75402 Transcript_43384/m.75402 type:complete len:260 (-) Transcript_43384:444-1223(-)